MVEWYLPSLDGIERHHLVGSKVQGRGEQSKKRGELRMKLVKVGGLENVSV